MGRPLPRHTASDVIVAPATAPGVGGVAIVRLSGPGAHRVAEALFRPGLARLSPGQLGYGRLIAPHGEVIDRCLAVRWEAPASFTGEDVVEFHLHGSPAVVEATLEACRAHGARTALPGEFTRRAFLNGKLDLAQAEAVAGLTASRTEAARRVQLRQLSGGLGQRLAAVRAALVQATAEVEARLDFPEEDLPPAVRDRLLAGMAGAREAIDALLATHRLGRCLAQGARVVLAGLPNAGKSSLFNALLGRERALVSPHPGTTRDALEATVDLDGIAVTLVDTAGLRDAPEEIEALGIARSREEVGAADLVLFLVDPRAPLDDALREYAAVGALPHLVLWTKADVAPAPPGRPPWATEACLGALAVTARDGGAALHHALVHALAGQASTEGSDVVVTQARHAEALERSHHALARACEGVAADAPGELVAADLLEALTEVDAITGEGGVDEAVLDAIFSTFCLGK